MKAMLRRSVGSLVASAALLLAPVALAAGEPCFNDTDCPGNGGDVCGGDVCSWNMPMSPATDPNKPYTCVGAGTDPKGKKGNDGWCTTTEHCKCRGQGATCVGVYCTFVKPDQAPPGSGGTPSGGAPSGGSGGAATGGSATGGSSAGSATAGAATAGTGTTPAPAPADEGGCSVAAPGAGASGAALALGLVGLGAMLARRRRSA